MQTDLISSLKREAALSRDLGRVKAENVELSSKLVSLKESLQKAKSSTRVALVDMAEQNAKLVAAYVEKKREVKQLQVTMQSEESSSSTAY
jgi:predicted  nucleic acid-binding Zn-ribbon protein